MDETGRTKLRTETLLIRKGRPGVGFWCCFAKIAFDKYGAIQADSNMNETSSMILDSFNAHNFNDIEDFTIYNIDL